MPSLSETRTDFSDVQHFQPQIQVSQPHQIHGSQTTAIYKPEIMTISPPAGQWSHLGTLAASLAGMLPKAWCAEGSSWMPFSWRNRWMAGDSPKGPFGQNDCRNSAIVETCRNPRNSSGNSKPGLFRISSPAGACSISARPLAIRLPTAQVSATKHLEAALSLSFLLSWGETKKKATAWP